MEECESLDSEMTELQELASDVNSQDDEDEVEELHNRYFLKSGLHLNNGSVCICLGRVFYSEKITQL